MSILLEALKKSEEQRQLGAAPTLQTPGAPLRARRGPGQTWVVTAMAAAAVGFMTWLGWSQFRPPEAGVAPASEVASAAEGGTEAARGAAMDAVSPQPAEPRATRPIPNVVAESPPPVSRGPGREGTAEDIAEKRRQLRKTIETYTAPEAGAASGDAGTMAEAPAPEPPAVENQIVQDGTVGDGTVRDGTVEDGADRDETAVLAEESAAGLARGRPAAPPEEDTISYWQIPTQTRQAMPELRIRVLVYADRPEDRFLLVNDQRLQEGEELESGLRLEEIRRDRAIFTYRDYRFHMKG